MLNSKDDFLPQETQESPVTTMCRKMAISDHRTDSSVLAFCCSKIIQREITPTEQLELLERIVQE